MNKGFIIVILGVVIMLGGMAVAMAGATRYTTTWFAIVGAFVAIAGFIIALPKKN